MPFRSEYLKKVETGRFLNYHWMLHQQLGLPIIGNKYSLVNVIHNGYDSGKVNILAIKNNTNQQFFAAKFDIENMPHQASILRAEYNLLRKYRDSKYVPRVYGFHKATFNGVDYEAIVMDLLGPNLVFAYHKMKDSFTIPTCLKLGQKMLRAVQAVHSKGLLHGEVNPVNFCFSTMDVDPATSNVVLIDFNNCRPFEYDKNKKITKEIIYYAKREVKRVCTIISSFIKK